MEVNRIRYATEHFVMRFGIKPILIAFQKSNMTESMQKMCVITKRWCTQLNNDFMTFFFYFFSFFFFFVFNCSNCNLCTLFYSLSFIVYKVDFTVGLTSVLKFLESTFADSIAEWKNRQRTRKRISFRYAMKVVIILLCYCSI